MSRYRGWTTFQPTARRTDLPGMLTPGRSKRRLDGWEIVLAIAAVLWLVTVATYAILR